MSSEIFTDLNTRMQVHEIEGGRKALYCNIYGNRSAGDYVGIAYAWL